MARVLNNAVNPWSRIGGLDIQRADLWFLDFTNAVSNINKYALEHVSDFNRTPPSISDIEPFYVISSSFPSNNVKSEAVPKFSNTISRPSHDDPLDSIQVSFHMGTKNSNSILDLLEVWRALVRAGRYAEGELGITLNSLYSVDSAFNIELYLASGSSRIVSQVFNSVSSSGDTRNLSNASKATNANRNVVVKSEIPALEVTAHFTIKDAWLSKFKITDLNYTDSSKEVTVDATFYASNIIRNTV